MKTTLFAGILLCLMTGMMLNPRSKDIRPSSNQDFCEKRSEDELLPTSKQEKTVLVVFEGATSKDLSELTVRDSNRNIITPLQMTEENKPLHGVYYLSPGRYSFSFCNKDDAEFVLKDVDFDIGEDMDKALVSISKPAKVFGVKSDEYTYINPLYADIIEESDIPSITIEEQARALEEFFRSLES